MKSGRIDRISRPLPHVADAFRVCVEQKVITERKYASFGLLLEKIGKQATSWKQYNERGMKKQEDKRQ
ncbi:hypothetical protein ACIXNN_12475 [Bacteroides fragilis]